MPRLFTGLEIPDDVRAALSMLRGGLPGARWIDPENYHLTLRFIGDVDVNVAHDVASMLDMVNRAKFDAWSGRKGTVREDAMKAYIELVNKLKSQET